MEQLFYKKDEYFMSNWAKFRQQLHGYIEWLIFVTLFELSALGFE